MDIVNNIKKDPQCNEGIIKCLKTVEGKKGIFSILLIATILTVFEIVFFYNIITPSINEKMNTNLDAISKKLFININEAKYNENNINKQEISKVLDTLYKDDKKGNLFTLISNIDENNTDIAKTGIMKIVFNDKIKAILNTFSDREKNLTKHINKYTMLSGLLLLTFLIVLMILIWKNIKKSELGLNENYKMSTSILTALFTVFILISFQILFFFFGKKYYYPGSLGNEELTSLLLKRINIKDKKE